MMIEVNKSDLEFALECLSFTSSEVEVYVCKKTGKVWSTGFDDETIEEEDLPDDLSINDQYIMLPNKNELQLGRKLALSFTEKFLPDELDKVYGYFRRSGAYRYFKHLLASHNLIDNWFEYEAYKTEQALKDWCKDNELILSTKISSP